VEEVAAPENIKAEAAPIDLEAKPHQESSLHHDAKPHQEPSLHHDAKPHHEPSLHHDVKHHHDEKNGGYHKKARNVPSMFSASINTNINSLAAQRNLANNCKLVQQMCKQTFGNRREQQKVQDQA